MDFKELRREYETSGIDESVMQDDPLKTFATWIQNAADTCPDALFESNAMTLATAGGDGVVTSRIVLLKGVDADAIRFYTNYESTKGQQLAENPNASVNFHWPWLGRQVRMRGTVSKTSREDSEKYFHSRPRGSQLGALVSRQSTEVTSRDDLEKAKATLEVEFAGREIPLPEFWGGYSLQPIVIEFWQGRRDRLHDRLVYKKVDSSNWTKHRLSP